MSKNNNTFFGINDDDHQNDELHNFGSFMDDAATETFPMTHFPTTTTSTVLDTSFDAAFASSDVPIFDSTLFGKESSVASVAFANHNTNNSNEGDDDDDAFNMNIASDFAALRLPPEREPPVVVYDHTPFTTIPPPPPPKTLRLHTQVMVRKQILPNVPPLSNPANGHVLFLAASPSGATSHLMIYEVDLYDTSTSAMMMRMRPITSTPLLSSDLCRIVAAKYQVTLVPNVLKIWTWTMGFAPSSSRNTTSRPRDPNFAGRREQLAAIMDLRVLEATTTLRLVVVWQRNVVTNRWDVWQVTTPPSGGDFASDLSTLQVANGLLFVGGASPKGSCIFISQLTDHRSRSSGSSGGSGDAWSANFVTGMGSVLYLSASMTRPYLVVALADKSITVWTYESALRNVDHHVSIVDTAAPSPSKRWLFPLCRLHYSEALSTATPEYPGTEPDDIKMDGKSGTFLFFIINIVLDGRLVLLYQCLLHYSNTDR